MFLLPDNLLFKNVIEVSQHINGEYQTCEPLVLMVRKLNWCVKHYIYTNNVWENSDRAIKDQMPCILR